MGSVNKITFDGKPVTLKFDNFALFNFAAKGAEMSDLLVGENADADKFCRAWACALGVEYGGDARAFMSRFNSLVGLNALAIAALANAGIIKPPTDDAKKNKRR